MHIWTPSSTAAVFRLLFVQFHHEPQTFSEPKHPFLHQPDLTLINLTWLWRCPCPTVKFEINGHCFDTVDAPSRRHKHTSPWIRMSCPRSDLKIAAALRKGMNLQRETGHILITQMGWVIINWVCGFRYWSGKSSNLKILWSLGNLTM